MANSLGLVIQREYFERVKRKSFIISTILVPIVMIALMLAPAFFMLFSKSEQKTVMVVDNTGVVAQRLVGNDEVKFVPATAPVDSLRANEDNETILILGSDAVENPAKGITLLSRGSVSMMTDAFITGQIKSAIEDVRLQKYNIPDIKQIMEDVTADVKMTTIRIDQEKDTETSSELSYFLSLIMDMMLYMFILIYGQMVMTSIIEEKNNRVLEIVVSSVKPTQLMLGKICGIGLVAVTQIVIWGVLIGLMSAFLLPALLPADMATQVGALNAGTLDASAAGVDTDMLQAISMMGNVSYILGLFGLLILFLVGGFLLYSAIYAAIGSAVDNIQDAGQLQSFVIFPIIIGIVFGMTAASDPTSSVSFWCSMIPFTSPMVMMARIPSGIPAWEIVVSLVLLFATFFACVYVAAKIYRVGIFMYGKKPTFRDLIRWTRYK